MTKMVLIALVASCVIGCENLHQTVRTGTILGSAPPGQPVLLIGNHDFTDFETVKTYIRSLPRGAILSWDVHSLGVAAVPLPQANMTVNDFSKFCRQNGVAFRFVAAAQKAPASTVLVLAPSGFRTFCEILSSPNLNVREARQLFAECQVEYAANLQLFFENAGVPFPPKTSVLYDQENGRLFVYNTRANQDLVSRIVWSYQTPDFDAKIRCVEGRLKTRRFVQ